MDGEDGTCTQKMLARASRVCNDQKPVCNEVGAAYNASHCAHCASPPFVTVLAAYYTATGAETARTVLAIRRPEEASSHVVFDLRPT